MTTGFTRLYISPFDSDLFPAVAGKSFVSSATNISYHTIQTFPELRYGYIDLPSLQADQLKKKLDGAILRGAKMKVSVANPKKRTHTGEEVTPIIVNKAPSEVAASKPKKGKKEKNVIQGHELSPERKVKRGWTENGQEKSKKQNSDKADRPASKYRDKQELLFRTKVPANRTATLEKKEKKGKKAPEGHTVHEYAKSTTQPSFLRQSKESNSVSDLQYVDGQGWVNAVGKVIEEESGGVARKRRTAVDQIATRSMKKDQSLNSSRVQSSHRKKDIPSQQVGSSDQDNASTSGSSSSAVPEDETDSTSTEGQSTDSDQIDAELAKGPTIHPLEALFKKPRKPSSQDIAKPSLEISTSFSFFDPDDAEDIPHPPGTPFSSQDVRSRGLRSAAPTPDTAHPSRFNSYGSTGMFGDEEIEVDEIEEVEGKVPQDTVSTPSVSKTSSNQTQSDFEKSFWEKRGENSRAWKLRRRTVLKEKRHRENRARRPRNW